jgi:hypothetical protein
MQSEVKQLRDLVKEARDMLASEDVYDPGSWFERAEDVLGQEVTDDK